jgi:hypothetical protein
LEDEEGDERITLRWILGRYSLEMGSREQAQNRD